VQQGNAISLRHALVNTEEADDARRSYTRSFGNYRLILDSRVVDVRMVYTLTISHFPTPARSPTLQVNIKNLFDDVQCYQTVRELRWPDGIACPSCQSKKIIKRGFDDTELARQRYERTDCHTRFDDLTDTIFTGHHQPLKVWVLCRRCQLNHADLIWRPQRGESGTTLDAFCP
jgi:transposase-like protein